MVDRIKPTVPFREEGQRGAMWCGPAAISALTGYSTTEVSRLVARSRNNRRGAGRFSGTRSVRGVKAMTDREVSSALEALGYKARTSRVISGGREATLAQWARDHADPIGSYVVLITGHFVAVHNGQIIDNRTCQWADVLRPGAPYRRARVKCAIRVQ